MTPLTLDEERLLDAAGETSQALLDRMNAWVKDGRRALGLNPIEMETTK